MKKVFGASAAKASFFALLWCYLVPVWAHGVDSLSTQFSEGFAHPWRGADHLLAGFALGLWASSATNPRAWRLPVGFWLAMAVGTQAPYAGTLFEQAEGGIVATLALTGLCLAGRTRPAMSTLVYLAVVAGFCHGVAHAAQIVDEANRTIILVGLLSATAIIHGLGIMVGGFAKRLPRLQTLTGLACLLAAMAPT